MRHTRRMMLFTLLALAMTATVAEAQRTRGDRNRLTRTELDEGGAAIVTARDAIRVLRPQWLTPPFGRNASAYVAGSSGSTSNAARAGGSATGVVVYIDGVRQTDVEALLTVPALKVVEMRYLDQNRAVQMHGPGHEMGAIEVTTVDKRK